MLICLASFGPCKGPNDARASRAATAALAGVARGGAKDGAMATTNEGPVQVFVKTVLNARRHLVAAAVARSTSIFAMYPVDTIKVKMNK